MKRVTDAKATEVFQVIPNSPIDKTSEHEKEPTAPSLPGSAHWIQKFILFEIFVYFSRAH
jgi:hypothetical protein